MSGEEEVTAGMEKAKKWENFHDGNPLYLMGF